MFTKLDGCANRAQWQLYMSFISIKILDFTTAYRNCKYNNISNRRIYINFVCQPEVGVVFFVMCAEL